MNSCPPNWHTYKSISIVMVNLKITEILSCNGNDETIIILWLPPFANFDLRKYRIICEWFWDHASYDTAILFFIHPKRRDNFKTCVTDKRPDGDWMTFDAFELSIFVVLWTSKTGFFNLIFVFDAWLTPSFENPEQADSQLTGLDFKEYLLYNTNCLSFVELSLSNRDLEILGHQNARPYAWELVSSSTFVSNRE